MSERLRRIFSSPEFAVALFGFLLHFVWEFWQVPYYADMPDISHWQGVRICTMATIGDVVIVVTAFVAARLATGSRHWILEKDRRGVVVFVLTGLGITIAAEWVFTDLLGRWAYADGMPVIPVLGTGLTPFLQWLILPFGIVLLCRPFLRGMHHDVP